MKEQDSIVKMWPDYASDAAVYVLILGGVLLLFHYIRYFLASGLSRKYDYLNKNEAKFFFYSFLSLVVSISLFLNSFIVSFFISGGSAEFGIGIFLSIIIGVALGYALYAFLKFYYPTILERKLTKIRFKPRISPKTGKPMKLLTEDEEDVHLTAEMIEHEESLKYEYDVWLDEETGHKFIERYDGHQHAKICENCNFRTMTEYKEEELQSPTRTESGLGKKYYKCSYCGWHNSKEVKIAALNEDAQILAAKG